MSHITIAKVNRPNFQAVCVHVKKRGIYVLQVNRKQGKTCKKIPVQQN